MKKIILNLGVIVLLVGCQTKQDQKASSDANSVKEKNVAAIQVASLHTSTMTIEGMTCPIGCVKKIETELTNTPGVKKAVVNFEAKTASIEYDTDVINEEGLAQVVTNSGDFTVHVANKKECSKSKKE